MTFNYFRQFAVPAPHHLASDDRRALIESASRLLAQDQEMAGLLGRPSATVPDSHALRCEMDARAFRIYGIVRDDVDYILDTFPIVKRKDDAQFGEYRTKRLILEAYDHLSAKAAPESVEQLAG